MASTNITVRLDDKEIRDAIIEKARAQLHQNDRVGSSKLDLKIITEEGEGDDFSVAAEVAFQYNSHK
jgi:hypothetical protein